MGRLCKLLLVEVRGKERKMISIVIPVYNVAEYLSDMLESVVQQSYQEIEVILVNDGSTDNSSAICHEYANHYDYITVYDCENQGVSVARNFGIQKASGEFIWFMDSDDVLAEDALLQAVEAQKKYSADIVIGGMKFCFDEDGRVVPKTLERGLVLGEKDFKCRYRELFSLNYISALWNKLIKRSILIENDIKFHESLCMYEDYVFCMDALLQCKTVVCLSGVFYHYKVRSTQSLSRKYKENVKEMFGVLEEKISGYKKVFGSEFASANESFNNLLIYLAYECVKNEAKHKHSYKKIKEFLAEENLRSTLAKCKGAGTVYKAVKFMMEKKMAALLWVFFVVNHKI